MGTTSGKDKGQKDMDIENQPTCVKTIQGQGLVQGRSALDKLPDKFNRHFNNVMSLLQVTRAQKGYVDQLCKISTGVVLEDKSIPDALTEGRHILKMLQTSCGIQATQVEESIKDLYSNLQRILTDNKLKCLKVDESLFKQHLAYEGDRVTSIPNEKQQCEIEKLTEKLSKSEKKASDFEESCKEVRKNMEEVKCELNKKEKYTVHLNAEIERLTKEIEILKPSKISASVQLFYSHSGNTIKTIESDLKTQLETYFNGIDFIKCHKKSDIDESKMVIVLCIITTRVGTDAANAIKDIPRLENTILLLFHIKESHAITKQTSTAVLNDGVLKDLCGKFDMAFANGKGLFQCEMNEYALKQISAFIRQGNKK